MNIPHTLSANAQQPTDAVEASFTDPMELVVFNMADASHPGAVVTVSDEYGVPTAL